MRRLAVAVVCLCLGRALVAQSPASMLTSLTQPQDYSLKRISSFDRTGANNDSRAIPPGETLVLMNEPGPGSISHIWITIATKEPYHLKKLVLRMYWDDEATPSVEPCCATASTAATASATCALSAGAPVTTAARVSTSRPSSASRGAMYATPARSLLLNAICVPCWPTKALPT